MNKSIVRNPRIEVVDALRGFAVMAILLLHNIEHFIFPVYPETAPAWLSALDTAVFNLGFALFGGKAYAIFALLFGFTFYIQSSNRKMKGQDFGYRFLWRLVLLAVFATVNAAFFPAGDVLMLFVVVGPVLFITRGWSDKALLAAAVVCLMQPVEWYHYAASVFVPGYQLPDWGVGQMYADVAEYTRHGSFTEFVIGNVSLGQKASLLWAVTAGRFFQTAGMFMLGCYIGRKQLFVSTDENTRFWTITLVVSAIAFVPLATLKELVSAGGGVASQTAGTALDMWQKLAFMFVLTASFVLLYQGRRFRDGVSVLRTYGRMSLTNYLTQSVIGAVIYFPFGLYLASFCGYTLSLLIGIGVFFVQAAACKWWLARHKQGPLEHLWHKWTWLGTVK